MLTYSASDLHTLRHDNPPARAVRKSIFRSHLWRPCAERRSADRSDVNNVSADHDRRLRIGWLNVRSLNNKTVAVRETIESNNLDVLALTETWHQHSGDVCLRDAAPPDFAVADVVRRYCCAVQRTTEMQHSRPAADYDVRGATFCNH